MRFSSGHVNGPSGSCEGSGSCFALFASTTNFSPRSLTTNTRLRSGEIANRSGDSGTRNTVSVSGSCRSRRTISFAGRTNANFCLSAEMTKRSGCTKRPSDCSRCTRNVPGRAFAKSAAGENLQGGGGGGISAFAVATGIEVGTGVGIAAATAGSGIFLGGISDARNGDA